MVVSASPPSRDKNSKLRKPKRSGGILAGCRSNAALDSVPRHARGPNAAFNRLQARDAFPNAGSPSSVGPDELGLRQTHTEDEEARDMFGAGVATPTSLLASSTSRTKAGDPAGRIKRSISLNRSSSSGANSTLAKRAPPVSSADLPPTISGLEPGHEPLSTSASFSRPMTSQGLASPRTQGRGRYQSLPGQAANPRDEADNISPSSPTKAATPPLSCSISSPSAGGPARKRVVVKSMIGNPTNFKHTRHIGTSSYGTAASGAPSEALRLQLSEVAAALKLDDPTTASTQPYKSPDADLASLDLHAQSRSPNARSLPPPPLPAPPSDGSADAASAQGGLGSGPDYDRAVNPSVSSRTSTPRNPPRPLSPLASAQTPPGSRPSLPLGRLASPASPSRGAGGGITAASPPPSNALAGASRRKPVPKALPELGFEAQHQQPHMRPSTPQSVSASATADTAILSSSRSIVDLKEHGPLPAANEADEVADSVAPDLMSAVGESDASQPAQLGRQVSVMGKLPGEIDFAKFVQQGSPVSRRINKMASIKNRDASLGEGTLKRWGLAEAFADQNAVTAASSETSNEGGEQESSKPGAAQQPQKKMVEGPAGTYITDTANGRWNSAMDEIRKALAADDGEAKGEKGEEDQGIAEGMRLADEVLKKLGVEEPGQT